jgi:hypothetical protein
MSKIKSGIASRNSKSRRARTTTSLMPLGTKDRPLQLPFSKGLSLAYEVAHDN